MLIFLSQLAPMLGAPRQLPILQVIEHPSLAQPLTCLVGVVTCLVIWLGPRAAPRIPAIVLGLVVGTGMYYGLAALGQRAGLGPIIGAIPAALGPSYLLGFVSLTAGDLRRSGRRWRSRRPRSRSSHRSMPCSAPKRSRASPARGSPATGFCPSWG